MLCTILNMNMVHSLGGGGQTVEGYEETKSVQTTATVLPTQGTHCFKGQVS